MLTAMFGLGLVNAPAANGAARPGFETTSLAAASANRSPPRTPEGRINRNPRFMSTVTKVTASQLGATWHVGCPVAPSALRSVKMSYVGFDGQRHLGTMIVNVDVVNTVRAVFAKLYALRFPLEEMVPESVYRGNDNVAAAADDTSGFNCRDAVAPGPPRWSVHAYGEAIDVNDVQNPYIDGTTVIPPAGTAYRNRARMRPGMAVAGGAVVEAFAAVGWFWGGRWSNTPDYQHFSLTGG